MSVQTDEVTPLLENGEEEEPSAVDKRPVRRTWFCLLVNMITLFIFIILVSIFGTGEYVQFGPSENLKLIGITIDTWPKWVGSIALICIISIVDCITVEFGMPFISFRIYDPDVKEINDISPFELQILANGMYFCSSMKSALYTLAIVTQMDYAIARVIASELTSIYTIRVLIKEKKFN